MTYQMTLHDLCLILILTVACLLFCLMPIVVIFLRRVMDAERRITITPPATPRTTNAHWRPAVHDWHTRKERAVEK